MEENSQDSETKIDRRMLGGWGLIAGDAAMFAHGALSYIDPQVKHIPGESDASLQARLQAEREGGKGLMATGIGWGLGGAILAKYGKRKVEDQLIRVEEKLAAFMVEKGIPLDGDKIKAADREQQRGWFNKFEDFLYDNPTEVMNGYYALASLGLIKSGLSAEEKRGDLWAGVCVITGALAAIFIKEKSPRELAAMEEPKGLGEKISRMVSKKPLALSSLIYMTNNIFATKAAYDEQQQDLNSRYMLRYGMVGGYVMSNIAVGSGSKKAGGTAEERAAAKEKLVAYAAEMLMTQPESTRQFIAGAAAEFLVNQKDLRLQDEDPKELGERILAQAATAKVAVSKADGFASEFQGDYRQKLAQEALVESKMSLN